MLIRLAKLLGLAAMATGLAAPAMAANYLVDLGNQSTTTSTNCSASSPCNLGANEIRFGFDSTSVGLDGYNGSVGAYVTQKWGPFNAAGGESGAGMSTTSGLSDSDGEIVPGTYLLINAAAARAAGYQLTGVWVESMQSGEGAQIFGYTGTFSKTLLNTGALTSLGSMTSDGSTAKLTQEIVSDAAYAPGTYNYLINAALATYNYIVVTAVGATADVSIAALAFNSTTQTVPEPASMVLLAAGLAGLGLARRRRA